MSLKAIRKAARSIPIFVLSVFLIAAAASFAIVAGTADQLRYERRLAFERLATENQARVRTFEQYVLRTLDLAEVEAQHARMLSRSGGDKKIEDASRTTFSPFSGVVVIRGRQVIANKDEFVLLDSERDRLVEMASATPYNLYVSPPQKFSALPGEQIAVVAKANGSEPVVALFLEPKRFTQFANDIPFATNDLISLIGLDGITRARRNGQVLSSGEPVKGLVMERQLKSPNGSYVGPSVLDGKERIFSHRRISEYGLFATSGRPLELISMRIAHRRTSLWVAMTIAVLVISIAAAISIFMRVRREQRLGALLRANRRLSEAQQIGQIADWDYDPKNDRLVLSDHLLRMYGRPPNDAPLKLDVVRKYLRDGEVSVVEKGLNKVITHGVAATWEIDVVLPTGAQSKRRITAVPVRNKDGEIIAVHGTDQDITAEGKVRDLELKISEAARLNSMNALAATLAHELNQPLGVAINYINAAKKRPSASGDQKLEKFLDNANSQLDHLARIVASARELAVHAGSSVEEVDLEYVVNSTVALLRAAVKRKVDFSVSAQDDLPRVLANGAQIKQVLFNLAKNGIEAVPSDRKPLIAFQISREENRIRFEVEDNGDGSWNLANDPFAAMNTTKKHGLGLGLSLARTIIESHGGKIWIEKTGSEGTVVAFELEVVEN